MLLFSNGSTAMESIALCVLRARMKSALENETTLGKDDLQAALEDFIPPSYPTEIELQNLVAVLECTSRALLPERYRNANRGDIVAKVQQLKLLLGQ